jgi:uroporphyrin-III C-methyltransferase/precorrin-2 dehydrogenase/sirohydrochlorin ferrochelatase
MEQLPLFHLIRGKPVLLKGEGPAADSRRRLIEAAGGVVVDEPGPGVRLAFIVTDDEQAAESAARKYRASGLLVNVADRPDLCDLFMPAIVDRSPVVIAIGTGGMSASLAKVLRERFERMLPTSLGTLATALHRARGRIRSALPDGVGRRLWLHEALSPGGLLDPLVAAGDPDTLIDDALAGRRAGDGFQGGEAELRTIEPLSGDPEDLTLRQLRWLARADTIFHAPDVPARLLDRARRDAARVECPEAPAELPPGLSVFLGGPA